MNSRARSIKLVRATALTVVIASMFALLVGCSAINQDPEVGSVGSVKIMYSDYYSMYSQYSQYASMFGYDTTTADGLHKFQDYVMELVVDAAVLEDRAKKDNIELTEEDMATVDKNVEDSLAETYTGYKSQVDTSITDEAQILVEEQRLFEEYLKTINMTLEKYKEELRTGYITSQKSERLIQNVKDEITIEDSEATEYYNTQVAAQKTKYDTTPADYYTDYSSFINATEGSVVVEPYYIPEGYIRVKHIYIAKPSDAATATPTPAATDGTGEEVKDVETKLSEIDTALAAEGLTQEKFNELIAEYGEDPGMQDDSPYKDVGYLVHADIVDQYYTGFADAALALSEVGDVTGRVESTNEEGEIIGYHYIMLWEKVESKTLELNDELFAETKAKVLNDKQTAHYEARFEEWKNEASITRLSSRIRLVGASS